MPQCGYVGYESHEYRIEESGEWTPISVIVQIRGRSKEIHKMPKTPISDLHKPLSTSDIKQNYEEEATKNPANRNLKRGSPDRMTQACNGVTNRIAFIDKVQQEAMINDGAKLADDVLALPVWAAAPSIRFKTIGVQLTQKRMDTDAFG